MSLIRSFRGVVLFALHLFLATAIFLHAPMTHAQVATFDGALSVLNIDSQSNPTSVAVDRQGNIYTLENVGGLGATKVVKITPTGSTSVISTGSLVVNNAYSIAVDGEGNVYIADTFYHAPPVEGRIVKVTPSGVASELSSGGLGFFQPRNMVVDSAGNVYVADTNSNRIVKVAPDGSATILNLGGLTVSFPYAVALNAAGDLYIADYGNSRIVELTAGGSASVVAAITGSVPTSLAVDGAGNLYVVDFQNKAHILKIAPGSSPRNLSTGNLTLQQSYSVAADEKGNVYIVVYTGPPNNHVVKVQTRSVEFDSANVCASGQTTPSPCSQIESFSYIFSGDVTLGTSQAPTLGKTGLGFSINQDSTCASGSSSGRMGEGMR